MPGSGRKPSRTSRALSGSVSCPAETPSSRRAVSMSIRGQPRPSRAGHGVHHGPSHGPGGAGRAVHPRGGPVVDDAARGVRVPGALAALQVTPGEHGPAATGYPDGLVWREPPATVVVDPGKHLASGDGDRPGEPADADPGVGGAVVRPVAFEGAAGKGQRDRDTPGGQEPVAGGAVGPAPGEGDRAGGDLVVPAGVPVTGLPGPLRPAAEVLGVAGGIEMPPVPPAVGGKALGPVAVRGTQQVAVPGVVPGEDVPAGP